MFANFFNNLSAFAEKFSFDAILWFTWGTFIAIYVISVTLTFALPGVRAASKKPFLCLVNCYAVITMELFLTQTTLVRSVFAAGVFWLSGYLCYGLLCAFSRFKRRRPAHIAATATVCPPAQSFYNCAPPPAPSKTSDLNPEVTAAKNNVKLEHASAVTEKLLSKNLGKSDRQQLEKLKTTLEVLKVKGELTPAEGEMLNENFNALLKLMAKYNI